jgi:ribonuclease kappa
MKPVVGVMQAWSWSVFQASYVQLLPNLPLSLERITGYQLTNLSSIVISIFAIIILSVIGALFKSNHHSMMGSEDDPEDGPAVAATVFSAVIVYAVRINPIPFRPSFYFPMEFTPPHPSASIPPFAHQVESLANKMPLNSSSLSAAVPRPSSTTATIDEAQYHFRNQSPNPVHRPRSHITSSWAEGVA